DSPPSLGLFTVNALTAADTALVPLQAHVFALGAMDQIEETIGMVRQLNPMLSIGGIVITMVDRRTSVNGLVEQAARDRYGDLVFATTIPLSTRIVEAPAAGQPITLYAPDSAGAQAYRRLPVEARARFPARQHTSARPGDQPFSAGRHSRSACMPPRPRCPIAPARCPSACRTSRASTLARDSVPASRFLKRRAGSARPAQRQSTGN